MTFKKGDRVRCVSLQEGLTEGKEYAVIEDSTSPYHTRVLNDGGKSFGYYSERFELVTSSQEDVYLVTLKVPAHEMAKLIDHVLLRDIVIDLVTKDD